MKEFNLEEYLKNPDRRVVTRDGLPVRIVCTDMKSDVPIIALLPITDDEETVYYYYPNGRYYTDVEDVHDLMFAPIKKEGWVNIHASQIAGNRYPGYSIFPSEKEARCAGETYKTYIVTVKVEWEE